MNTSQFRIPQEPFLSRRFLSPRNSSVRGWADAKGLTRHFTFWARNAIYHSLRAAKVERGEEVLVPAYICKVVPEAIAGYGAKVVFYRIDRNCMPDFADIENKLSKRTRALVAVHFFGFPQPIERFVQFCRERNLFLIEDCSHVLNSEIDGTPLGSFGDVSIFSFRKFYPLYDGGELILNRPGAQLDVGWAKESPLFTLKVAKDFLDQIMGRATNPLLVFPYTLLESLKKPLRRAVNSSQSSNSLAIQKTDATFDPQLVNHRMSRLSRFVLNHSDSNEIAAKRRANYRELQERLAMVAGIQLLVPQLRDSVCPWVLPLTFEGVPDACQSLRQAGIPAVTWDGVRPGDLPCNAFPDAEFLYKNLVFLPVHQNLTQRDLDEIVLAVKTVQTDHPSEACARQPIPAMSPVI